MKPLSQLRVLNTRPLAQGLALSREIEAQGGVAISCPLLDITHVDNDWLNTLPPFETIDYAIFTSINAVHFFFSHFTKPFPQSIKVIAIGKGTAEALSQHNISIHAIPVKADSEHLLQLFNLDALNDKKICLIKGEEGRTLLAETFKGKTEFIQLDVYKRQMPKNLPFMIEQIWRDRNCDIILITSQQALINLFHKIDAHIAFWLKSIPCLVISERLEKAAVKMGMKRIIKGSPDTIIQTLQDFNKGLIS